MAFKVPRESADSQHELGHEAGGQRGHETSDSNAGTTAPVEFMSFGAYFLVTLFCVGLPAFFTAAAPISYVRLERNGDSVRATAATCLLFVIPFSRQQVGDVIGVNDRLQAGINARRTPRERSSQTEDQAFLVIHGRADDAMLEVAVSPVNLKSRVGMVERFLQDQTASRVGFVCVSNWKFAVFVGGLSSLLTLFWAVSTIRAIVLRLRRLAGL